ncbi:MAG: hypothetical protein ABR907_01625 [Terracidiphilus sp.]
MYGGYQKYRISSAPPMACSLSYNEDVAHALSNPGTQQTASNLTLRFEAPVLLRLWHLTSLDAPTVAVVWTLGFAWAAGVRLPAWVPILVALATWAVYIGDRLLDVRTARRTGKMQQLRARHFFHHRHRAALGAAALGAACAAAAIILRLMPVEARERNSVLALAAMTYFSGVHFSREVPQLPSLLRSPIRIKEFIVGLLFTAGCVLPIFGRASSRFGLGYLPMWAAATYFAALAALNCCAIERWERPGPAVRISGTAGALALAGLPLAALLLPFQSRVAILIALGAASAVLLALLDRMRGRLTPLTLRAAADLVLLTPLLILAVEL